MLDSAVGEGLLHSPRHAPSDTCWGRRPAWATLHPGHTTLFLLLGREG